MLLNQAVSQISLLKITVISAYKTTHQFSLSSYWTCL